MVTTIRALEALGGRFEFALKTAFKALVDGSVGSQVTDVIVGPVPNGF